MKGIDNLYEILPQQLIGPQYKPGVITHSLAIQGRSRRLPCTVLPSYDRAQTAAAWANKRDREEEESGGEINLYKLGIFIISCSGGIKSRMLSCTYYGEDWPQ